MLAFVFATSALAFDLPTDDPCDSVALAHSGRCLPDETGETGDTGAEEESARVTPGQSRSVGAAPAIEPQAGCAVAPGVGGIGLLLLAPFARLRRR
ncbi:MAG: hypothetical protein ABMA64_42535 [Myxococcota bacterium]